MPKELPSPDMLRKLLRYDPETGNLFWRERPVEMFPDQRAANSWNARFAGAEAFTTVDRYGYQVGCICVARHKAHRVIWAIEVGSWPVDELDHINGVRDDNRIANLREVSHAENLRNQRRRSTNTSGVVGVSWCRRDDKWEARIMVSGRKRHLGAFTDFDAAVAARRAAEAEHGYHENHGRDQ